MANMLEPIKNSKNSKSLLTNFAGHLKQPRRPHAGWIALPQSNVGQVAHVSPTPRVVLKRKRPKKTPGFFKKTLKKQ